MVELVDQMPVVRQAAARYWQQDESQIKLLLDSIEVIKRTGGKVVGFFPAYQEFPSVFFKVYFYDRGYRFETTGLQAAAAMPPVEGVRVPSVIAIMPEYKAILLEKRAWEDSSSPWKRLWVNQLGIDWFKVGAWVRVFHDSQTTYERNDYFLRKKYEKFESHLNALKHLFTADQVDKMNLIYASAREYFERNKCEWVISHGDFGLDNIKKSGAMLEIVDFEDCQSAPREFDLINLSTRTYYGGFSQGRQSLRSKHIREFLDGYGTHISVSPLSNFFYLLVKIDMIESYFRRRKRTIDSLTYRIIYTQFERKGVNSLIEWLSTVT